VEDIKQLYPHFNLEDKLLGQLRAKGGCWGQLQRECIIKGL